MIAERETSSRLGGWLAVVVCMLPGILFFVLAFQPPALLVRYLSDDAYYYYKVALNLAAGHGFTFDGLTRTTGVHPLFAVLLAGLQQLLHLSPNGMVTAALLLNGTCFYLAGLFLYRAAAALWNPAAALCAGLAWFSNPHAILLVATGLEGSLYAACLAALLWRMAASPPASMRVAVGQWIGLGVCGAFCVWARTDAIIVLVVLALYPACFRSGKPGERRVSSAVLMIASLGAWGAWMWYCRESTGQAFSGSAGMKMMQRQLAVAGLPLWQQGGISLTILAAWLGKSLIKVPLFKYAVVLAIATGAGRGGLRRHPLPALVATAWLAWCVLGCAYACLLPRIWTWYYAPALVVFTLATAWVWRSALDRRSAGTPGAARLRCGLVVILAIAALESYGYLATKGIRGRNRYQIQALATAEWMRDNLPPGAIAAAWNTGIYGFYSGRTVINLDGLINDDMLEWLRSGRPVADYLRRRNVRYIVDDADADQQKWFRWNPAGYSVVRRGTGGARSVLQMPE